MAAAGERADMARSVFKVLVTTVLIGQGGTPAFSFV